MVIRADGIALGETQHFQVFEGAGSSGVRKPGCSLDVARRKTLFADPQNVQDRHPIRGYAVLSHPDHRGEVGIVRHAISSNHRKGEQQLPQLLAETGTDLGPR
jgi:hypothetical protein